MQPIDLGRGELRVENKYDFLNLNVFDFLWEIMGDGKKIAEGVIPSLEVEAKKSKDIIIDWPQITVKPGVEYFLQIFVRTTNDTPLRVPVGHIVAWDQFKLPMYQSPNKIDYTQLPKIEAIHEDKSSIKIIGKNFTICFDKTKGVITTFQYKKKELIVEGLVPNFWRAPTDNDIGNGMPDRCEVWKEAGKYQKINSITASRSDNQTVLVEVSSTIPVDGCNYRTKYTVYGSGDVFVENKMTSVNPDLPELPRFGMTLTLPSEFRKISW
jgi:beta-galactosidase